jgi:small subunit ribosomal protein S1
MAEQSPEPKDMPAEGEFAALMEASLAERGGEISVGDRITGPVVAITETNLVVDTGTKLDGVADKTEFLDENGAPTVHEGDMVTLYVVSVRADEVVLSKALTGQGGAEALREAFERGLRWRGGSPPRAKAVRRGDPPPRAFCPVSRSDSPSRRPEVHVGRT